MLCKVCQNATVLFATSTVLQKYAANYYHCKTCDFLQVENPFWLEEAYSSAITRADIGLPSRNIAFSKSLKAIIESFYDHRRKFVDYGGGTGLLTRLMRDLGYDCYCYDRHCENQFADFFRADLGGETKYELLSAVEVFEHLVDPLASLKEMLELSPNILFTTKILPRPVPQIDDWWYYGPDHGQHVSFYGLETLRYLAGQFGLNFTSDGSGLHMFSTKPVNSRLFRFVANKFSASVISSTLKRRSLLETDFEKICRRETRDESRP